MSLSATPNWTQWLYSQWGGGSDGFLPAPLGLIFAASNVVTGTNPPYTIQDFYGVAPAWGGTPATASGGTIVSGQPTVVFATIPTPQLLGSPVYAAGMPVAGNGIPDNAFIQSISLDNLTWTLTVNATASGTTALTIWNGPLVPTAIILLFIKAAVGSLSQARWIELWPLAMFLYVSHYLTLYARTNGNPTSTIGQIVAAGLSFGIQTSKAVGSVSVGYQVVSGLEDWGTWNLTTFGQELATLAIVNGSGDALIY